MPRPDTLTPEFLARAEKLFDDCPDVPDYAKKEPVRVRLLEIWIAGTVLQQGLQDRGCDPEFAQQIGFAHGQLSFGRDPWDAGEAILNAYDEGFYPPPGEELAKVIAQQTFAGIGTIPLRPLPK
jgi:hypothetical protein